jgi:hypothetical protein
MRWPGKVIVAGGLVLACLAIWVVFQATWPAPAIVVSKETTWLTEPLADDGLPDYAGYLLARQKEGVTPETNGAIPFLQAMWPAGLAAEHRELVCREMGMEVPQEEGMVEPKEDHELTDAVRAWLAEAHAPTEDEQGQPAATDSDGGDRDTSRVVDLVAATTYCRWRREEFPLLAEWIDRHAEHYQLLHEAAARPKFYAPEPTLLADPQESLVSMEVPIVQSMQAAARCLAMRGYLHLGAGNVAAAWRDCEAIYRLSGQLPSGILVNELLAYALNFVAHGLSLAILDSPELTPEVARKVFDFHQQRVLRPEVVEAIDRGERLMLVTTVLELSTPRGEGASLSDLLGSEGLHAVESMSVDWNIVLRECNAFYDRLVAAMRTEDREERDRLIGQVEYEFNNLPEVYLPNPYATYFSREARSRANAGLVLALFLPSVSGATRADGRYHALSQLTSVAAALALHRLEQGEYPQSLESLIPDHLKQPPVDGYGHPLVYQRTESGYLLYSLGANEVDDEGSNDSMQLFKGYRVLDNDEEALVRELLGLPPLGTEIEVVDEVNGNWTTIEGPLSDKIPSKADDWAIRMPLPRLKLPLSPVP